MKSSFRFVTDSKQHKECKRNMITPRNHAPLTVLQDRITHTPVALSVLWHDLYNLQLDDVTGSNLQPHCTLSANQKKDSEFDV